MNGTKWYKLNKSNEPLEIAIEEQVSRLEEYIDKRSSSTITEVGGTIFSSILAVLVEKAMIAKEFSLPKSIDRILTSITMANSHKP